MHQVRHALAGALVLATLLAPLPADTRAATQSSTTAAAAAQDGEKQSTSRRLRLLVLDSPLVEQSLAEVRLFREAGFLYQPGLALSSLLDTRDEHVDKHPTDRQAVASGMVIADRSFAFFFGTVADVEREQTALAALLPEGTVPPLSMQRIAALQKELGTEAGRRKLATHVSATSREIFSRLEKDPALLRLVGAQLYGIFVERMYLTAVMGLAAVEEGTEDPLRRVKMEAAQRMREVLRVLSDEKLLGEGAEAERRAGVLRDIMRLATGDGKGGHPTISSLEAIVDLCEAERDAVLTGADRKR